MFPHVEPLCSQRDMYCRGVKHFFFFIPLFVSFIEPKTNESYNNDLSKSYVGTFSIQLCRIDCTTACLTLWSDNKWSKKKQRMSGVHIYCESQHKTEWLTANVLLIWNVAFILLVNKCFKRSCVEFRFLPPCNETLYLQREQVLILALTKAVLCHVSHRERRII